MAVFTYNSDLLLINDYQQLIQTLCVLKSFRIPKEIEICSSHLNFRHTIYHKVNSCISAKMGLLMDDMSSLFSLDTSKNFEKQVHEICSWAINSSNTSIMIAVIGIQKAIKANGLRFSRKIQEYLLSFLLDSYSGNQKTGNSSL